MMLATVGPTTPRALTTQQARPTLPTLFAAWCELHGLTDIGLVQPVHVAAHIEGRQRAAPSIK